MDMALEEFPALSCRFEFQSDNQRSENEPKVITDELVLDVTFIFQCSARHACFIVRKLPALAPISCP